MKIWCLLQDQFAHVKPVERAFGGKAEFVYDSAWDSAAMLNARPDLVLCVNDYPFGVASCLDAARKDKVPSLLLQDGILEWRCQYENPLFGAGGGAPQHQPVLADKIACIGQQSVRQIAAWGNAAKVELTGMPRFDEVFARRLIPQRKGARVLIMTAKNPGFTAAQRATTSRSLSELKYYMDSQPRIEPVWRVSKSIAGELGINNQLTKLGTAELTTVLEEVDAVITTPSTAMLEAMAMHRPVAILDYHNVPAFIHSAWRISAKDHIPDVIGELLNPPAAKLSFQSELLADALVCDGSASQRVRRLIEKMVAFARDADGDERFPEDLLGEQNSYYFLQPKRVGELYAHQSAFEVSDVENLQVRLARAANENARLKSENAELRQQADLVTRLKKGIGRLTGLVGV